MAFKLILFPVLTALVAVNLIYAEGFGLPSSGDGNSSDPSSAFAGFLSQLPFPSPFGSRQERSAEPEDDEDEPHDRFFWARRVSCNYTTQGGSNCTSCRQVLTCYPNNVGRVRTCRGLLRYCNSGRCSFIPGEQCGNSTSA